MDGTPRLIFLYGILSGAFMADWPIEIPTNIEALSGSCVFIPCSFDVEPSYDSELPDSYGVWRNGDVDVIVCTTNGDCPGTVRATIGKVSEKNCTTVIEAVPSSFTQALNFRVEVIKYTFKAKTLYMDVKDSPPKPTLHLHTVEVVVGALMTLSCSAASPCPTDPPNLTWSPGLGNIEETLEEKKDKTKQKISVLKFIASLLHHEQQVICSAVYKLQSGEIVSSVSDQIILSVQFSPRDTTVSLSGSVLEGQPVTLTCSSQANPQVTKYTWYRGGQVYSSGSSLNFNPAKVEDNGVYFCEAENKHGKDKSTCYQLNVQYPPKNTSVTISASGPVFCYRSPLLKCEGDDKVSVLLGSSVTLRCSAVSNPQMCNYTWYKVNESGPASFGETLNFNMSNLEDRRMFYCVAQNVHGSKNSSVLHVDVSTAPRISHSTCSRSGAQINCFCESLGNPSPTLEWRLPANLHHQSTNETVDSKGVRSFLTIHPAGEDTPTVQCVSTNFLGSANVKFSPLDSSKQDPMPALHVSSLLIGTAAGAAAIVLLCSVVLLTRRGKGAMTSHNRPEDAAGLVHNDGEYETGANKILCHAVGRRQETEHVLVKTRKPNCGVAQNRQEASAVANATDVGNNPEVRRKESLHYATLDFPKCHAKGGGSNEGGQNILGDACQTTEYAVVRHKHPGSDGQDTKGEVHHNEENLLGQTRKHPQAKMGDELDEAEEVVYGNIIKQKRLA
ncbi:sialoadhesin-like isoform X1 [Denticeps clupeoides]|uniref:Ig-like domain-containing protein n=1 Tax=Denticeps clupeoides TaxID=299321 RepID=A0AAY4ES94_9TELE|nr:sialoadhesin-like isoform X1 [Denticeps clupeoides]XP_028836259.1 sialoadhesin-like isoform X1 [Denticeps clupeoides]XP_028836260.1 sialoadhesin-like isoform X1 [Denticeps clupeoides]